MPIRLWWTLPLLCCVLTNATASDKKAAPDPRAPLMLDEIHYYLTDRASAILFFETHFGAHQMAHPGDGPLNFITMLSLEPTEGVLEFSPPGPFEGVEEPDSKRWEREFVSPSPNVAPRYGVYWLALRTTSLKKAAEKLESRGVKLQDRHLVLPGDAKAKAVSFYGPDANVFALVERAHRQGDTGDFGLDHVQLLVKNVAENIRFLEDVLSASVIERSEHSASLAVGGFHVNVADPEGLELQPAEVQPRSASQFRFEADHISFLFADIHPAVDAATSKGYKFSVAPRRLQYFGKPTPYTFAVINSPDGLPFELVMEEGRTTPRQRYSGGK